MSQATASKADLLVNCSYPFGPDIVTESSPSSPEAEAGIAFHKEIATRLLTGRPSESLHVERSWATLTRWLVHEGYCNSAHDLVEKSVAWCPADMTARIAEPPDPETHIYPDARPGEIMGTADLIIVPPEESALPLLVLDHKTGYSGDFSQPEKLGQLQVLSAAAMAIWGKTERNCMALRPVVMAVLHSPADGIPVVYSSDLLSQWHVAELVEPIRRRAALIGDGSMRPGAWCKRCPALSQCPAKSADLLKSAGELVERATLVGSELVMVGKGATSLSREERIGRLHLLQTRFREIDKRATAEIKREMTEDPELAPVRPDGKRLKLITSQRTELNEAAEEKVAALRSALREAGEVVTVTRTELRAT